MESKLLMSIYRPQLALSKFHLVHHGSVLGTTDYDKQLSSPSMGLTARNGAISGISCSSKQRVCLYRPGHSLSTSL
jgi:hypothetical protein